MPRQRSAKSIFVEAIFFIGLLALVGHLSVNFWERFIIQSELTQIKTSLHSLKETLANIGTAYDNLHKELKGLIKQTEQKHIPIRCKSIKPEETCNGKSKYSLDRRNNRDLEVRALLLTKSTENERGVNKTTEMENKNLNTSPKHVNLLKNATTLTRYPQKTTGAGNEHEQFPVKQSCWYKNPMCHGHVQCYKDWDRCKVHPCHDWK